MGLSEEAQKGMARALNRAADHFEERAGQIDDGVSHWRKDHARDSSPVIAQTMHSVAQDLRNWAKQSLQPS
jgi:hypothetical protein